MKSFGKRNYQLEYKKRDCAYAIIQNENNDFLVVADKEDNYYLIGGKIENEETPIQTIHREAIEETGYETKVFDFIGKAEKHWVSEKYPNWSQHNIASIYSARLEEKITSPIEQEITLCTPYATLKNKLFHEHHLYMVNKYLNYL